VAGNRKKKVKKIGKSREERPVSESVCRWWDNVQVDVLKIRREVIDWINPAQADL
jgi:hypothetical protein